VDRVAPLGCVIEDNAIGIGIAKHPEITAPKRLHAHSDEVGH
jgi:hypothetical protein